MSHSTKAHSQGNIPFSWEDRPGVSKSSKVTHCDNPCRCPIDVELFDLNETNPPSDHTSGGSSKILVHDNKVPPPPPFSMQLLPNRSTSVKGLRRWWWQDDPFLAAYKECTKSGGNGKLSSEASTNGGSKLARKKKKINFSCKNSSEVRDDNLVRFSNLPPFPKDRIRGTQEFV